MKADIIAQIKAGDEKCFYDLYKSHRPAFISWAVFNHKISLEETKDIYQEVFLIFWKNVNSGNLTHLTSDVKTYLYGIAKYLILNSVKKNGRTVTFSPDELINSSENPFEMSHERDHNRKLVEDHLNKLDDGDRKILELYYLDGNSTDWFEDVQWF